MVTRFAPTPSGYLHLGNVLSFAITWALARQQNGRIVLRIDDIDSTRLRREYVDDIFSTLDFLGLGYDAGPANTDDFLAHYSQQLKTDRYKTLIDHLIEDDHAYACDCSRSRISETSPSGHYTRACAHRMLPHAHGTTAYRLRVPEHCPIDIDDLVAGKTQVDLGQNMPDFVVLRKDGIPAYQIASLYNDLELGITCVVRGKDLIESTAAQIYLSRLLGLERFEQIKFLHHPLVLGHTGTKLSKSNGDTSIYGMRKNGVAPSRIWAILAEQLKMKSTNVGSAQNFTDEFNLGLLA